MNKKLWTFLFSAVLLACAWPAAAAGPECADALKEAGYTLQEKAQEQNQVTEKDIQLAQMALQAGLQTFAAHEFTGELTQQDKKILELLDNTFPKILNKIKKSITEVEKELTVQSEELAKLLIANQTLYPQPRMDVATPLAGMTAMSYAMMGGKLDEKVLNVLMEESAKVMEEMLPSEE